MKIKKIYFLAFLIVFIGCENNILDTTPVNQLSNELFWENQQDAQNALNAVYSFIPGVEEIQWDMLSDIGHANTSYDGRLAIELGEHGSTMGFFSGLWNGHYQGIRRANYFLENVNQVVEKDPLYTDELNAQFRAEVRVIRAMLYMRLAFWFGDVPLVTETLTPDEAASVSHTPREDIIDFIYSELSSVAQNLPVERPASENGRITRGAAFALNARAMLYNNRYQQAAEAAEAVINLGVYSLNDSFEHLFGYEAQSTDEIILDRQYTQGTNSHGFFASYAPHGMNGNVGIAPTRTLVDAFKTINGLHVDDDPDHDIYNPYVDRDPRLGYTLFLPTFSDNVQGDILYNERVYDPRPGSRTEDEIDVDLYRTKTGFSTKKYINEEDLGDPGNNGTNFILLRFADVLLMYAEAKIELNQLDDSVYDAINKIRTRPDVNMPVISEGKSQDELRSIVRNERMTELAMEGLRFWDIRRWRIAENVMVGNIPGMDFIPSGETEISTRTYSGTIRVFDPNRDYLFPIPAQELVINQNLTQNPGY